MASALPLSDETKLLLDDAMNAVDRHTNRVGMIDGDGDAERSKLARALRERAVLFLSNDFEQGCDVTLITPYDLASPNNWPYIVFDRALTNLGARGLNPGGDEGNDIPTLGNVHKLLEEVTRQDLVITIDGQASTAATLALTKQFADGGWTGRWTAWITEDDSANRTRVRLRLTILPHLPYEASVTPTLCFVSVPIVVGNGVLLGKWFAESDVVEGIQALLDEKNAEIYGHIESASRLLEDVNALKFALRSHSPRK